MVGALRSLMIGSRSTTPGTPCLGCGKNIIITAYGDLALPIDSRPPIYNEIVCGEF